MAEKQQIICDVCGRVKGETNHWIVAVVPVNPSKPGEPSAIAFGNSAAGEDDEEMKVEDLCGEACAHTRLSQWLTGLTSGLKPTGGFIDPDKERESQSLLRANGLTTSEREEARRELQTTPVD